jgi:hypothetical protein
LDFVSYKEAVAAALKQIYRAKNAAAGLKLLILVLNLAQKELEGRHANGLWRKRNSRSYSRAGSSWRNETGLS